MEREGSEFWSPVVLRMEMNNETCLYTNTGCLKHSNK